MHNSLESHKKELYLLRFSTMCKPAGEVANLTQLESHTTRARILMMWRIASGHLAWGTREVELMYQSTLDSISEGFDVFHYPVSRYMLDGRADIWEAGLAPEPVKNALKGGLNTPLPSMNGKDALLIAGEAAQCGETSLIARLEAALAQVNMPGAVWAAPTGALAYGLGARPEARQQAEAIAEGIRQSGAKLVIADGAETAWSLLKLFPLLGTSLPEGTQVRLLSEVLAEKGKAARHLGGKVLVHDSRPAYFLADKLPGHRAILTGIEHEESNYGEGAVYRAPRRLAEAAGAERVSGTWVRGLAKSCGADDGLWLTYPNLAAGLAEQRLDYARYLKAETVVTDSPLCAFWLQNCRKAADPEVIWLPELLEK